MTAWTKQGEREVGAKPVSGVFGGAANMTWWTSDEGAIWMQEAT